MCFPNQNTIHSSSTIVAWDGSRGRKKQGTLLYSPPLTQRCRRDPDFDATAKVPDGKPNLGGEVDTFKFDLRVFVYNVYVLLPVCIYLCGCCC